MKILITGITGSGGSYLAEYILKNHQEVEVWGLCRWHSTGSNDNLDKISKKIKVRESDLMDINQSITRM